MGISEASRVVVFFTPKSFCAFLAGNRVGLGLGLVLFFLGGGGDE